MQQPSSVVRAVVAAALCTGAAAHANLLINGSFESGAFVNQGNVTMSPPAGSTVITGWTVVNDTIAWIGAGTPFSLTANDGNFFLDLTNYQAGPPFGGVQQTIATTPGAVYSLSFDLGSSNRWGRPDSLTASAGGASQTFIAAPLTPTNNDWEHVSMTFTAVSASTTVTLQGASGINYIGLDNASVDLVSGPPVGAVPEPETYALLLAGLATIGSLARRPGAWARSAPFSLPRKAQPQRSSGLRRAAHSRRSCPSAPPSSSAIPFEEQTVRSCGTCASGISILPRDKAASRSCGHAVVGPAVQA